MTITYALIGLTVLISMYSFNNEGLLRSLIMNPYLISSRKQYYRLLTSGFIHKDHMHLLLNMVTFYFFGGVIEQVFTIIFGSMGGFYFVILYLMAIVVSDLPTVLKHKSNPGYNSLGASGGVAAVVFASIILLPLQDICLYFALCMPGFILGTLYLVYSYYQGRKANDGINHDAHLYGALFGFLFCIILIPASLPNFIEQVMSWRYFH
ncbi:MAG: rhomboid family intramembrane serine protease [Cyclobacteriaceae bacterium]|nr:rhomboid family intramembrane serine protease [Cyclobacteriaceae bacterium]MDH5249029.1 rhomboid family intramembrane serine protease [Cyclobacteriaceae bacterium]